MLARWIDNAAFRLMYAMEEEERAWDVFPSPFGSKWTATDSLRLKTSRPPFGPLPDLCTERSTFETRGAAEHYVRWHCIRVGLIHMLCFWRKEVKWC